MNDFLQFTAANDSEYFPLTEGFAFGPDARIERKALGGALSEEEVMAWMSSLPFQHFKRLVMKLQAARDPSVMVDVLRGMTWVEFERAVAEAYQAKAGPHRLPSQVRTVGLMCSFATARLHG